ncbi:MAG: hypothetical protein AB2551_03165 [Candidatus Thiodiazotropha sp.]
MPGKRHNRRRAEFPEAGSGSYNVASFQDCPLAPDKPANGEFLFMQQ